MFGREDFVSCIVGALEAKVPAAVRDAVIKRFDNYTADEISNGVGHPHASFNAMIRVLNEQAASATGRTAASIKQIAIKAAWRSRVAQGANVRTGFFNGVGVLIGRDVKRGSDKGSGLARAAISLISQDPRFKGLSMEEVRAGVWAKYIQMIGHRLEQIGKGAFGRQRGKVHLPNVAREAAGENTGDAVAKGLADAWLKIKLTGTNDLIAAGGKAYHRKGFSLPTPQSKARVLRATEADYVRDMNEALGDWSNMKWPDGTPMAKTDVEKEALLKEAYAAIAYDAIDTIDPKAFGGHGIDARAMLQASDFWYFKSGEAWNNIHGKYSDGTVFDVIGRWVDNQAHRVAMTSTFGPNYLSVVKTIKKEVEQQAAEVARVGKTKNDRTAVTRARNIMETKFDPMFTMVTNHRAMDPESAGAATIVMTGNLLSSAVMGSVPLLAVLGDFMQSLAVRSLNKMPVTEGIGMYLKSITRSKNAEIIAAEDGVPFEQSVLGTFAAARFTGFAQNGPAFARTLGDGNIRLSGLTIHTNNARNTMFYQIMKLMERTMKDDFDALPYKAVLERQGIDKNDWDAFRKNITPHAGAHGFPIIRPIDILNTKVANREDLYRKFFAFMNSEGHNMVPGTSTEAQVMLRGAGRADTIPGAILHSFSMFKNFAVTWTQKYGRLTLAQDTKVGRLQFLSSMIAGSVLVGAIGTQLREIANGREPLDMNTAAFWGRAFRSGGALSIWGDFLFSGINEYGRGPQDVIGGPMAGFLADVTGLVFGDAFGFIEAMDRGEAYSSDFASRAVSFMRRNAPFGSLWYSRLAIERLVWDNLAILADPYGARTSQARRIATQRREHGNDYFLPPGAWTR